MVGTNKLDERVYEQNVKFWEKAWEPVKKPYTQMPDLPYIDEIPGTLKASGVKSVLDLGCGSGWLSILLGREGFDVTGIDVAEHAVDLGRQWAAQEQLPIKFDAVDIIHMKFAEHSFDAVVANSIFEHLTHDLAKETLTVLRRVMVPGGIFFGCFDKVGTGPGEYYELHDGTHVYTDKGRSGMLLRYFQDEELKALFSDWNIQRFETIESGSRIVWAKT